MCRELSAGVGVFSVFLRKLIGRVDLLQHPAEHIIREALGRGPAGWVTAATVCFHVFVSVLRFGRGFTSSAFFRAP